MWIEPSPTGVPFNRLRQPCRFMMKPIPPLSESGPSRVRGQGESEVFSPERPIELRMAGLVSSCSTFSVSARG